jgi:hypothetical protein
MSTYVICNQCGSHFDFEIGFEESMLCPACKINDWNYDVTEEEKKFLRQKVKLRERNSKGEKPFRETTLGEELFNKTKEWRQIERIVNRQDDIYYEKITDLETGEVIKEVFEKLSEHQGHGADKKG